MNPYEPPGVDLTPLGDSAVDPTSSQTRQLNPFRLMLFGCGGAAAGDSLLMLLSTLAPQRFLHLREIIAGRLTFSQAVRQGAELWYVVGLITLFVMGGCMFGIWLGNRKVQR